MPLNHLDEAFIRFQRTGNPDELALVFDGTAGRLLQLAHHLSPDTSTADDLVQATFLTAIEHRHNYKPKGHILSWLFGVLTNLAREQSRMTIRRGESETDPANVATLVDPNPVDPHSVLEEAELSKIVMDAIAELPETYQPILNLHLRFGLAPTQIAMSLNRPAGTVRQQLSRGLAILRKTLPASIIAGSVVLTTPAAGLAAMREVVLSKATAVAAKAASASSALAIGKLTLWTAAGTLTAAALAVTLMAPDLEQVPFDELSPKAKAQVVAQKGSVDSPAIVSAALQADPFPASSHVLMTLSSSAPHAPGGANPMRFHNYSTPSIPQGFGVPALLLGAMTLLPAMGQSQNVIYHYHGEDTDTGLGFSVNSAGDVNADGYADVVVGARYWGSDFAGPDGTAGPSGPGPDGTLNTADDIIDDVRNEGRVYVYSGKNGLPLHVFTGENGGMRLSSRWAGDGDELGWSVDGAGDVDLDGYPDILAGSILHDLDPDGTPGNGDDLNFAGRVYLRSGKDGSLLAIFDGDQVGGNHGSAVLVV